MSAAGFKLPLRKIEKSMPQTENPCLKSCSFISDVLTAACKKCLGLGEFNPKSIEIDHTKDHKICGLKVKVRILNDWADGRGEEWKDEWVTWDDRPRGNAFGFGTMQRRGHDNPVKLSELPLRQNQYKVGQRDQPQTDKVFEPTSTNDWVTLGELIDRLKTIGNWTLNKEAVLSAAMGVVMQPPSQPNAFGPTYGRS